MELSQNNCKNCGAQLDLRKAVDGVIVCDFCRSAFTVSKKETSPIALSFLRQGEHDLDTCKFDDAYSAFSKAAENDSREPEAYWGMALAEFKVQYIKDTVNNCLQPICHEFVDKSFTQNKNYLSALKFATEKQKEEYAKKAQEIDYIRSEFLKIKQSGLDYDCFICVKVSRIDSEQTDNSKKNWTEDAYDADAIYDLLKRNGYTPFFSEREIRGRTGADYEAMILYALYTSETMLVVCHDERYLYTPWVKNEYTRFKELVNNEEKENDSLTVVYNSKPIERLPGFNGKIQGIDYSRREADFEIVKFVETHTPLIRARREEEKQKKNRESEELRKELEELKKRQSNSNFGNLSTDAFLTMLEQAQKEKERKEREEAERKAREEAERRAREQAELARLREETIRKARLEAERSIREQAELAKRQEEAERQNRLAQEEAEFKAEYEIQGTILTKYKGHRSDVSIPQGITSIGREAFKGCKELVSVSIPNSVTTICSLAFSECNKLKIITIPDSVTSIDEGALNDCMEVTAICSATSKPTGWHSKWNKSNSYYKICWGVKSFADTKKLWDLKEKSENKSTIIANVVLWGLAAIIMGLFYGLNWFGSLRLGFRIPLSIVMAGACGFVGSTIILAIFGPLIGRGRKK